MVIMRALTVDERSKVWSSLNRGQKAAYADSIAYRISDRVLDQVFQGSARWRLFAVNIDYEWDRRKSGKKCSPPLRCICHRRVRYQFELESLQDSKKHVRLGSTHFAEHLGIPLAVAQEVRNNVNQIQSLMDEVLIKFRAGERFPERFKSRIDDGILLLEEEPFRRRILAYKRVDLPLTEVAKERLSRLIRTTSNRELAVARNQQAAIDQANESAKLKRERERLEAQRKEQIEAQERRKARRERKQAEFEQAKAQRQRNLKDVNIVNQRRHQENVARREQMWQELMARKKAELAGKTPEEIAEIKRQHRLELEAKAEKKRLHRLEVKAREEAAAVRLRSRNS